MIDDCGTALGADASSGDDEEQPAQRHLFELLPAAMIVGLAFSVAGALLRGAGAERVVSLDATEGAGPQASVGAPSAAPGAATFGFAAVPLRAALKEMGDRTGSIQVLPPAPPERMARPSIVAQDRLTKVERRPKAGRTATEPRPSGSPLQRAPRRKKAADPLTVVGRTASAMAERFATDLRALPGQISTILSGQ